jgi:RimJ/RimL family protein N-acetyltransferase
MEIRVLTEADGAIYRPLRLRALREEPESFGSSYEESVQRPAEEMARRLRPDPATGTVTLGAFDPALVGIVGLVRDSGLKMQHKAMIWGMYTVPEVRGRGVGRALLAAILAHACTVPGLEQVYLAVVTTRPVARQLYESFGFATYGVEPRALKLGDRYLDEALMVLRLRDE